MEKPVQPPGFLIPDLQFSWFCEIIGHGIQVRRSLLGLHHGHPRRMANARNSLNTALT